VKKEFPQTPSFGVKGLCLQKRCRKMGFPKNAKGIHMTTSNAIAPAVQHTAPTFDVENQQAIQTAPKPYNRIVTLAKIGAMAGMCAATSSLMLIDLAKANDIALPIQHDPGRELLGLPVNGTCPKGEYLLNKEKEMKKATILLAVFAGACPGLAVLSGIGAALLRRWDGAVGFFGTTGGLGMGGFLLGMPACAMHFAKIRSASDGTCLPVDKG